MVELSPWENWNPRQYLTDYYSEVQPDEVETIRFLVQRFAQIPGNLPLLELGCGPTLHHIFPAAPFVSDITMADYLEVNLEEVSRWLRKDQDRHNWAPFVGFTLECEGLSQPADEAILSRERMTREKVLSLRTVDLNKGDPLGVEYRGSFPLVLSCYCVDSATDKKEVWEEYMRNMASLVMPGGRFITAALRHAQHYRVGDRYFPSANVDEDDLRRTLKLDFKPRNIMIEVKQLKGHEQQGYSGIILAHAIKRE